MRSDLRDTLRSLIRNRGVSALAVLLLALTCGATIAVFAIVDAVLLAPLPVAQSERAVVIWEYDVARSTPVVEVGLGEVDEWLGPGTPLDSIAVFTSVNAPIAVHRGERRTRASSNWVSARFFEVAGIRPALGRLLDGRDETGEAPRSAVISDGYWKREFGSDPAVVGRSVVLQRSVRAAPLAVEIVGVAPVGFDFPGEVDVWLPAAPILRSIANDAPGDRVSSHTWYLTYYKVFYALARLRPGVTIAEAEGQLSHVVRQIDLPTGKPSGVSIESLHAYLVGPTRLVLWTMLSGAVLMLLLACSSIAGLQVFRAARQDRALAIQMALGAERHRLVRRALMECALMSAAAAVLAVGIGWMLSRLLMILAPTEIPRLATASVFSSSSVAAAASLALLVTFVSGLWPALFVARVDASRVLTAGARTAMLPRERLLQRLVVGWQIAAAVVLLTGAALFIRSVQGLQRTPLGFDAAHLTSVELQPSDGRFEEWDRFFESLLDRVEGLPTVSGAGAIARRPLSGPVGNDTIPVLEGQEGLGPDAPWRQNPRANLQAVTPGYFRAVGATLRAGRDFTDVDVASAPNVVIVGAATAGRFWPGRSPIGERILVPTQRQPGAIESPRWQTVVGVVDDIRYRGITDARLDIYMPATQSTIRVAHVLVRTSGPSATAAADVLAIARDLDPRVLTGEVVAMTDVVARDTAPWRFAMRVLTAFGLLAALLAAVGLVGLLWMAVTFRARELGIRAALGATPARLRAHVLSEALWIGGIAVAVGTLAAMALARSLAGLLVATSPHDAVSAIGAVVTTLALAAAGCAWPARRAAAADPIEALREHG